jgi:uncharacterized protein with ParB-like and HNH nuclease domain
MSSGFATPITIKDAIDKIVARQYLIPAIQRKFVWSSDKVETLFDSIMRGYPINSFMFWEIKDQKIKNDFKFYQFLTEYRQFFKENNIDIDTKGFQDFYAVIDGQQRLTSIYLGLKGSYAYKMPRVWWKDDEKCLPTRFLYVNITKPLPEEDERQMRYEFRFLSSNDYDRLSKDANSIWFKVNDILRFEDANDLDDYIDKQTWSNNNFAKSTIRTLRKKVFDEKIINYYLETSQEIDVVLDIFIRTNSGGEPLSFSNLLMSITTANWTLRDARKSLEDVVKKVFEIGKPGFMINADFILKVCLVLFNDNIKFQVKNFDRSSVQIFDTNWDKIKDSIIAAFVLLESWGFNESSLRAKNAVIPIIYYIYHKGLEKNINNQAHHKEEKDAMRKWLCLSLLKRVFSGQSDTVLTKIRNVLRNNHDQSHFPLEQIKEEFKDDPTKNLAFTSEYVDGLLTTQKDDSNCYPILALLYSHLNFNQVFHKDHLHPFSYFQKLKESDFENKGMFVFYTDPLNYNSIINLQLLNSSLNESKLDTPLDIWIKDKNIDLDNQLIPKNIDLSVGNFSEFVYKRKELLKKRFEEIVGAANE